jgi:hypothetical protein
VAKVRNRKPNTPVKIGSEAPAKRPNRKLTRATMIELYAARRYLGLDTLKETGLRMPVEVYFKDPDVAETYEGAGIDVEFTTPWEPGLRDGPTSARFAVVDYDSTTIRSRLQRSGTAKRIVTARPTARSSTERQRSFSSTTSSAFGPMFKTLSISLKAASRLAGGSVGRSKAIG